MLNLQRPLCTDCWTHALRALAGFVLGSISTLILLLFWWGGLPIRTGEMVFSWSVIGCGIVASTLALVLSFRSSPYQVFRIAGLTLGLLTFLAWVATAFMWWGLSTSLH